MSLSPAQLLLVKPDPDRPGVYVRRSRRERAQLLRGYSDEYLDALKRDWKFWARPEQLEPDGLWTLWAMITGRGFGKTRSGGEWVLDRSEAFARHSARHLVLLVGTTVADCRDVMVEGEALALDTEIPTPHGWTTMGDLRVGDQIYGGDGRPCTVTTVHPVLEDRPCFDMRVSGASIVADAEHKWLTWTYRARADARRIVNPKKHQPTIVTTEEIAATVLLGSGQRNQAIETTIVVGTERPLPIDPYTLGVWLGDGTSKSGEITCHTDDQPWIRGRIDAAGYVCTDRAHPYTVGVRGLNKPLRIAGLLRNKHVPDVYLDASLAQRLALVQGLIDSDGHVTARGQVEFSNRSERLLDDVVALLSSLGIRVGRSRHRLQFSTGLPVASLPRKSARIRPPRQEDRWRYVKAVMPTESRPVRCIEVDSPDRTFLVTRHFVRTHNSGIMACAERRGYTAKYEPSKRRVSIPDLDTTMTTFTAEKPDQLRGYQGHTAWGDEPAKWKRLVDREGNSAWSNLMLALRLEGELPASWDFDDDEDVADLPDFEDAPPELQPRVCATTTPKPIELIKEWVRRASDGDGSVVLTTGSTMENVSNLAPRFVQEIIARYAGTRLGAQEIEGILLDAVEGALWTPELIDRWRVRDQRDVPAIGKTVVAVDPSGSGHGHGDDAGILVEGVEANPRDWLRREIYVLEDLTSPERPHVWARIAVEAYWRTGAECIVAETNFGAALVVDVIYLTDPNVPVETVTASKAKRPRAEPAALVYDQGRAHHVGYFGALESEMCTWVPDEDMDSPNRMDALVWGMAYLLPEMNRLPVSQTSAADVRMPTGADAMVPGSTAGGFDMGGGGWPRQ